LAKLLPKRIRQLDEALGGPGHTERFVSTRLSGPAGIEDVADSLSRLINKRVPPTTLRYWIDNVWQGDRKGV
jgi:hypothetical protein